jgi:hypothetical protein
MFHLLVSFSGWADGGDTIGSGRIYVKADEEPGSDFLKDGKLDIAKVTRIPALLMSETTGREPQVARVAHITNVQQGVRDTSIQYLIDTSIPPMRSEDFADYETQLGSKYSLTHTHWEVCSGDLFRVLFLIQQKNAALEKPPVPTVFSTNGVHDPEQNLVSVMMPFGAEFTPVYKALQKAAIGLKLQCKRADDIWVHHQVIQDIVDLIAKAKVVICDCSGRNPNVFYEIGIAHTLGKDVILIARSAEDIPFDLRHHRFLTYLPNKEGLEELAAAVQGRLTTLVG